ncbi:hypothetical protein SteCoe_2458 [Stentor coeruleus]|uniref:Uncharacterized protein n=1 Tax=Stentor coeruleus TaxID=5963 RepID=A0A1R2CZI2_9CILI|nr:hypothetical protein SteCoe_2458 [Stentor coeruleus]
MKSQCSRRKYIGSDWYFVPDTEIPKTSRVQPPKLREINEKFNHVKLIENKSTKKLSRHTSEHLHYKGQSKMVQTTSEKNLKVLSTRYKSPWYINPQQWQQLALIPEKNTDFLVNRAKNLYYFLHKSMPNLKYPLKKENLENSQNNQIYLETQSKLAELTTVHNYKKYLETKKLRIPACLESLKHDLI